MRDWPGLQLNKRPVGDGFTVLDNVAPDTTGELNRRRGLSGYVATPVQFQRLCQHPDSGKVLMGTTGTSSAAAVQFYTLTTATGAISSVFGAPSNAQGGTMVGVNDAVYWADGVNSMHAIYAGTIFAVPAGITAPASAPSTTLAAGGSCTSGTHLIRYRYYDSDRTRYSDPSPAVAVSIAGQTTATGIVLLGSGGTLAGVQINDPGGGYMGAALTCTLTGGGGSGGAVKAYPQYASILGPIGRLNVTAVGSGYTSAPELTIPAPATLEATIQVPVVASTDFGVTHIIIEMTLADGSEFYQAARIANNTGTTSISMSDTTLAVQVAAADYTEDGYGHGLPPKGSLIAAHRSRMFCWGATDEAADTLYWSRAGLVESWKPAEWSRRVFGSTSDTPRAMFSLSDDLYLVGARSMARLIFTSDPGTGFIVQLPTTSGAWNQQCIVQAEGAFFGFGYTGVWVINSLQPMEISQGVRPFIEENLDADRGTESFAWWDPSTRSVTFAFPCSDSTWKGIVWWMDEKVWTTVSWKQTVSAAATIPWDNGAVEPIIATDASVCRITTGVSDMVGANTGGTVSSYADPLLTLAAVHDLKIGSWVYLPRTDQWGRVWGIPSSAVASITGLTGVSPGDEVIYGPIPWRIVSEWVSRESMERGKAVYLRLEGAPTEAQAVLQVRFYIDWASTPVTYTTDISATAPSGVTYDATNSRFLVDLEASGGMARVPVPSDNFRVIRYELLAYESTGGIHLIDAEFEAKAKKGAE